MSPSIKATNLLDSRLSDLKGWDPLIHGGRCDTLVGCVLDAFVTGDGNPDAMVVRGFTRRLRQVAATIRQKALVEKDDGLIAP